MNLSIRLINIYRRPVIVKKKFGFLRNILGLYENENKDINNDKKEQFKTKDSKDEKKEYVKEDKINDYFRNKIKKFDGRLN
jgi:hypothetical protein